MIWASIQFPNLDPSALTIPAIAGIGPLHLRWYALAYIAGLVLGWRWMVHLIRKDRLWAPGKPSRNRLISGGDERELTAKVTMTPMRRGDVFVHDQPGPGGWGDPLDREPGRVVRDVVNELVSLESARDDYGVVIDAATLEVDAGATARRRAELRAARGWTTVPVVRR